MKHASNRIAHGMAAMLLTVSATAQITLVGPMDGKPFTSLEDAGPKLFHDTGDSVIIYNTDLTIYHQWALPPDPVGFQRLYIGYITEDLFDNDPTTIEYYMPYYQLGGSPVYAMFIFRTDGSVLFSDMTRVLHDNSTGYAYQESHPIFNTPSGTFMRIGNGLDVFDGELYLLPGHLPCPECDGSLITGGGEQLAPPGTDLFLFPNPANEGAEVVYTLPQGTATGHLVFYDTRGQQVMLLPVDNSTDRVHVSTSMLAAGTYLYQLRTATEVIGGPRLVVVH